jgi:hypothetical protein
MAFRPGLSAERHLLNVFRCALCDRIQGPGARGATRPIHLIDLPGNPVGPASIPDRAGAERVAYVDIDVHHGDGVQAAFYDDPRVLTISLHEHPATLWPGTGLPGETGGPGAAGSAVNVALPAGTTDAGWLRAFHAVVPPLLRAFRPQILVSQHGCDTHRLDPLATCSCLSMRSAPQAPRSTPWPTRSRTAAGSSPAEAAAKHSRSCP